MTALPSIHLLPLRFDVAPLTHELDAHSDLWGQHKWRTEHPQSPHREARDIWLRYAPLRNLGPHFNDPHESEWYPAIAKLPAARVLAEDMFERVNGETLGGVLLTKVPAGSQVYPHADRGWHAEHYEKFAIQVAGNKEQFFCYGDGCLSPETGESFWFENQSPHWVVNESGEDRITLICCIRRVH
jgi:hypothetical protein